VSIFYTSLNFQSHNIINYITTSIKHPNNNQPLGGELATVKIDKQTVYDSRRSDARLLAYFASCSHPSRNGVVLHLQPDSGKRNSKFS
jgi:hypothetical protein